MTEAGVHFELYRHLGEDTGVLIERPEETEVIEFEGVSEARESTTLGDFSNL